MLIPPISNGICQPPFSHVDHGNDENGELEKYLKNYTDLYMAQIPLKGGMCISSQGWRPCLKHGKIFFWGWGKEIGHPDSLKLKEIFILKS